MREIYRAMNDSLVVQKSEKVNLTLLDMKYERAMIRLCSVTKNPELKGWDKDFWQKNFFFENFDFFFKKYPHLKCGPVDIELLFTSPQCQITGNTSAQFFFFSSGDLFIQKLVKTWKKPSDMVTHKGKHLNAKLRLLKWG